MTSEKWVTDLKTELEKKDVMDLEPEVLPVTGGSNLITPTKEESAQMVALFRARKTPQEIRKTVKRNGFSFSRDQVNMAYEAWQEVLTAKTAPEETIPDPSELPGEEAK